NVDERGSKIIASRLALLEEGKPPVLAGQPRDGKGAGNGYSTGNGYVSESGYSYTAEPSLENTAVNESADAGYQGRNYVAADSAAAQNNASVPTNAADAQGHIPVPISAVIELVISPERETDIVTKALIAILQKHHGSTMVFLKLMGSRRRIRLEPRYYVNGQDTALQDELKELLGDHAFRVKEI
ncbi:MAG: hypothetical protein IJ657_09205, partial [Acidaminococcaceae bacterium]|nr:hypothetical protein [Acidaminococcaceae bacterium]